MGWGQGAAELAKKIAEYHKELVTVGVRFEELRRRTTELINDFEAEIERLSERVHSIEKNNIEAQASMQAKIEGLSERLSLLSEKALHVAVKDIARQVVLEQLALEQNDTTSAAENSIRKRLQY
jgi:hypothetical protein